MTNKEQEPCDAISREALMHILDEVGGDFDSPREAVVPIDYIADMVSELPSVTPQPKMGQWVYDGEGDGYKKWHCSNCNMLVRNSKKPWYSFCPHCGQPKMKEV